MRSSDWSSEGCSSDRRCEGEEDDHLAEHGRFDYLLRSTHRFFEPLPKRQQPSFVFLTMRQSRQAVLDDDHGAIDDQTKVNAPRLIRLPGTRNAFIPIAIMRNEKGMTRVAMMAARQLPSSRNSDAEIGKASARERVCE